MNKNKLKKLLSLLTILTLYYCSMSPRNPLDSSQPLGAIYQLIPIFFPGLRPSSAKEMKTYFLPTTGSSAIITGTKMSIIVPYSTNLSSLSAEFYHTGKSSKVNGIEQISGQTVNSHSQTLVYNITAANATQKNYTISTTKGSPDSNTLFGFQFDSLLARGVITGTSVTINIPYGTDIKKLVPTFSHNGSKVYFNNTEQVSGKTANNFTNPLLYEVQAENGSRKQYTIVVVGGTTTSNTIQNISVEGITGFISGESIYFNFPTGQNISSVSPIISHLGATVTINGQPFVNGETTLDFTQPLKVKVTSADGTLKEYTIYSGYTTGTRVQSFTDLGNQTIRDNNNGLIWMKCTIGNDGFPLSGAGCTGGTVGSSKFCFSNNNDCNGGSSTTNLQPPPWIGGGYSSLYYVCAISNSNPSGGFAGKTNWRVPTRDEYVSLVDYSLTTSPVINITYFPNTGAAIVYWSSTPLASNTSDAWYVGFADGVVGYTNKTSNAYVRCVSGP